jgi:ABC-2 type transport system permease protein
VTDLAATAPPVAAGAVSSAADERRRFRELVLIAALTDYRRRYAGSVLGYAWTVLRPLMLFAVLYTVFTRVIRFGGHVPDYQVLLLFNIVLFFFFQEGATAGLRSFVARGAVLRSVRISPLTMPVSAILTALLNFAASLVVVVVWILVYGIRPTLSWLWLPALLLYLIVLVLGVGVLLACLYVRYRDVGQAWHPLSRLLFYASPVIFPFELIPQGFLRSLAAVNPLSPLFVQARHWIIDPSAPTWAETVSGFDRVAPFVCLLIISAISVAVYLRTSRRIPERL